MEGRRPRIFPSGKPDGLRTKKLKNEKTKRLKEIKMDRKIKDKFLKRFLAILMALVLVVNSGGLVLVYAEDIIPTPIPTPQQDIATGDASSDSSAETIANVNIDQISGEVTTPPADCTPPEGQIECPVNNDNSAETSSDVESSATTGQNTSTGSEGDASITTGDATASGSIENTINENIVEATPGAEPSVQNLEGVSVANTNEAVVGNNAEVLAGTGENLAIDNLGNVDIQTGDALAYANIFNLLNTNIVGSNFEILVLNLVDQNGNIDLNALWKEIMKAEGQDQLVLASQTNMGNLSILVQNDNLADLENNVDVTASTGQNEASNNDGNASVQSGSATALANVTNVVNTNLVGSKFLLVFINILSSFTGDLILPRPENFKTDIPGLESETSALTVQNQNGTQTSQNQAEIAGGISASADSGTNLANNNMSSTIVTGDSDSATTNLTIANINVARNSWFFLTVNNLGSWLGSLMGWSDPTSEEIPTGEVSSYSLGSAPGQNSDPVSSLGTGGGIGVENQNQAEIHNDISVNAITGQNQTNENGGEASIATGKATALGNLLNLANLNIFGGRWFMGMVNVLGNWQGNTVFAYPDVAVDISGPANEVAPGEEAFYDISFKNDGYDQAQNVVVKLELPKGANYVSDSSGSTPVVSGSIYTWNLGSIAGKTAGSFKVKVKIDAGLSPSDLLSFWQKIIPQAHAAEDNETGDLVVKADVSTIDPQSNTNNDSSQTTTTISFPSKETIENPILEITANNNVGEFVYPGDTVSFELVVKNEGTTLAKDVSVSQAMYDGSPEDLGSANFNIGDLAPGKSAKVSFGMTLENDLPAEIYTTSAKAFGFDQKGNDISSNEARTQFEVRGSSELASPVEAESGTDGTPQGQVLSGNSPVASVRKEEWMLYLLAFLLGAFGLIEIFKRKNLLRNFGFFKRNRQGGEYEKVLS